MSKTIPKQQKVTLLLKIIQDCLASAKSGQPETIREPSQRLVILMARASIDSE